MNTLTGADFLLTYGTLVQVRVTPTNNKGTGATSDPLTFGATIRTVPRRPAIPTRGVNTNEFKVHVDWLPLVTALDRGNSPILGYRLFWDNNSGVTSVFVTEGMLFSYTILGILQHQPYKFKVQARNIYGYGDFSDEATIMTTDIPHIMDPLGSWYNGNDVRITWSEP